jgi:hypothetical protein
MNAEQKHWLRIFLPHSHISDRNKNNDVYALVKDTHPPYKMTIVDLSRHYMADNFVHNNKALLKSTKFQTPWPSSQVTTMLSNIPSACTKSLFADLYLEILTKSAVPC